MEVCPLVGQLGLFDHSIPWFCEFNPGEGTLVRIIPNISIFLWILRDKNMDMGIYWVWSGLSYLWIPSVLGPLHTHLLWAFLSLYTVPGLWGAWEHYTPAPFGTVLLGTSPSQPSSSASPCAWLSCFAYELLERDPLIFLLINSLLNNSWRYRPLIFRNLHHHTLTDAESWAFWSFCFRSILIFLWPLLEGSWDIFS